MNGKQFFFRWFGVFTLLSLLLVLFASTDGTFLALAVTDGMDINWIYVEQYNGTAWNLVQNFTTTGGSERILDTQPINFTVCVYFNKTLAAAVGDAVTYTRVNGTIGVGGDASIWNNVALNYSGTNSSDATFWYLWYHGNWTTSLAVAGTTYNCTFLYQGYY